MLIFVDGFSHYSGNTQLAQKWDVVNTSGTQTSNSPTIAHGLSGVGRFGAGGVAFDGKEEGSTSQKFQYMQKNYNGVSTIICGFAFKQGGTQCTTGGRLLTFMDGSTVQVAILVLQSGQLRAVRSTSINGGFDGFGGGGVQREELTTLGQSTNAISSSSFDFLEFKVIHHPTTGSIEVKRNGSAFWTLSNVNTAFSGVNNSSSVIVGGYNVNVFGTTTYHYLKGTVSDFYLLNTVANGDDALDPVDFIGDRRWEPLPPTQDGEDTAWSTTGSADHFANVDEVPPNETDFNSTSTVGARDGFVVQSPTGPAAASALIAVTMFCKKDTGGSNAIKCFARSGGGSYRNGTEFQVPNPYAFRQSFLCSKPGGGAITVADVASHQWGYEKTI